ncbi:helix-turn-helix domain-containing protein [Streptomyces sp. B-S-A8]|uniref:Helix-turn-helix domain-containing protein n=1 Tax=Streptomyces solicavernae TaxID=3043614 RepID=A0ABT6RTS1_9ACTN|nr:helix-turn-helix domain-containing protein [Streptomyces sp. B-S-A8]MDI3387824.1 helix-turn-helix domain-containing protein [Streptomyces sp. B-S-A8]
MNPCTAVQASDGSTAVEAVAARDFAEWRRMVSESYVPLQVEEGPGPFVGSIRSLHLDGVLISGLHTSAGRVLRTPKLAAQADRAYYKLSMQLSGSALLVQDGREALLTTGDFTLYDSSRPYTIASDEAYRALVMMFPRSMFDLPVHQVATITGTRISGHDGLGRLVSRFLQNMAGDLDALSGTGGTRLVHSLLGLVSTALAERLELRRQDTAGAHRALAVRARAFIEANLGHSSLSPDEIAGAHFVSTRHLQNVFREEGTTVTAWIRERRLERCRRELCDPINAQIPVSSIAARWGFPDAAHFSRVFKSAYGASPSDCRSH